METDKRVNILVVDDSPDKLLALGVILDDLGQNVVKVTSGREALRHLLVQDFAVILLDVNMPEIDGFETAALIRQRKKSEHTPIIFITAFGDESHVSRGYSLGAVDYILTPVVPEILRTKIAVFVDLFQKTELIRQQARQQVEFVREQTARAAAEEANRRSVFLAEASHVLAHSLEYSATLASTARMAVPTLGDVCVVSVTESGGRPAKTEVACDPLRQKESLPGDSLRLGQTIADATRRVLSTGKTRCLPSVEDMPAQSGLDPLRSAIVLPLVARGVIMGTMTLGTFDPHRRYTAEEVRLAEDLADRAAIAIDNARLYQEIRDGDRRKDEFLAMLGHELRNPLGAISTALQCLELDLDKALLSETRGILRRQVHQMSRLVDDLLDVSRITRGKIQLRKEVLDLSTLVERAVDSTRSFIVSRGHELSMVLPSEPVHLKADPTRLEQVLCNLLNNAAKYSEPGGHIRLSAELNNDQIAIRVKDQGIGIQQDLLPRVFDLFTQADRSLDRSQGGLGIGLTLAKSLVTLHGGQIEAFSAGPGTGSEFTVRLPAWQDSMPVKPRESRPGQDSVNAKTPALRILLVDDNADLAAALGALLRTAGHEVHLASSGPEAIEIASAVDAQIAVIDIGLPGMNGYELARRLREQPAFATALLIAMTGYGQAEDRRKSKEAGFNYHLVKPVRFQKLHELLDAWAKAEYSPCSAASASDGLDES